MYTMVYILIEGCQISTQLSTIHVYTVSVVRDHSRLEHLELLLFLIVSANFETVSVLQSIEIQHQI